MKVVLFANTEWYLYNFRRSLALALRDAGYEVLLLSPPGPYGARLQALGLRWEPVPMQRRSLNPVRELALLAHLWRVLRREKPDLVHGFTIKCAVYGALAARLAGVHARVSAVAGMGYVFTSDDTKARLLRPLVRALLKLALGGRQSRLILQNPDDVELFRAAGLGDSEHVRLIPGSGVDCTRFQPGPKRLRSEPTRVLLASRLLWDKGIAEYAEAAASVRESIGADAVQFLLAGNPDPGNPAAVPETFVRKWVADGLLQWLGHVEDMPTLLSDVDMAVLPSYREGLPKGLIEAAASGRALVTTDVPGCREVVTDGVDGLIVTPRDAKSLAAAILRLHADPVLVERLGRAARLKALDRFDERRIIEATLNVYRELLEPSS